MPPKPPIEGRNWTLPTPFNNFGAKRRKRLFRGAEGSAEKIFRNISDFSAICVTVSNPNYHLWYTTKGVFGGYLIFWKFSFDIAKLSYPDIKQHGLVPV